MTLRRTIIIAPPPTPNGSLHLGHLAGPYLAGDVYARYLRACGRPVTYATGTDDSQTYVLATARKRGITPEQLCADSTAGIQRTLTDAGVTVDGFAPFDDGYRRTVLRFLTELHAAGQFRLRTMRLPMLAATGEFLMEGLVAGGCPTCLAESRGGLCETCGHPVDVDQLIDPRATEDPDALVVFAEAQILVLPMEEYRQQLVAFCAARRGSWRPRMAQLVDELLARPLPDFPITYPSSWGIPAPFAETPGQVLNAWAEGMAASMYCTWYAAGGPAEPSDESWRAEHGASLVYFLGFDNAYFWGMTHVALLMAHGDRYIQPETIVPNEFYELENEKFSTSRGHVIWAADLLTEVPRDLVRFYLALTAPEHHRTNFSRAAFDKITSTRLVGPWNRLADELERLLACRAPDATLPVPEHAHRSSDAMADRFRGCYELPTYSLTRAADLITLHVDRLLRRASTVQPSDAAELGALCHEVRTLLGCASPIMVDTAADAATDVWPSADRRLTAITPFELPRIVVAGQSAHALRINRHRRPAVASGHRAAS